METGQKIREYRQAEGVTRKELAAMSGVKEDAIRIAEEKGLFFISEDLLMRIATGLKVQREQLAKGEVISLDDAAARIERQMSPLYRKILEEGTRILADYQARGYSGDMVAEILQTVNRKLCKFIGSSIRVSIKYNNSPLDNYDLLDAALCHPGNCRIPQSLKEDRKPARSEPKY